MGMLSLMRGSIWRSHILKAELANLSRMYTFNLGMFSLICAQGNLRGSDLVGHVQGGSPGNVVPVLVHDVKAGSAEP